MNKLQTWFIQLPPLHKAAIAAGFLLITFLTIFLMRPAKASYPRTFYIANAQTFELKTRTERFIPPEKDDKGIEWVNATVVRNPDGTQRIAYLEKYTDKAAEYLRTTPEQQVDFSHEVLRNGTLVALPKQDSKWVSSLSAEGLELVGNALKNSDGSDAQIIFP